MIDILGLDITFLFYMCYPAVTLVNIEGMHGLMRAVRND